MTILNRVSSQVILAPPAASAAAAAEVVAAPGQALFGTNTGPGTFSWTVPANVKTISAVAIGGGGGGAYIWALPGGSGGGLGWRNNIQVQPGQTLTVQVGFAGTRFSFGAGTGGDSYVGTSSIVRGGGGPHGDSGIGYYTGDGGGNGGNGGDLGQDGADGVSSYGFTVGGTAGDAIHGQSFIVWENIGTIYGATS